MESEGFLITGTPLKHRYILICCSDCNVVVTVVLDEGGILYKSYTKILEHHTLKQNTYGGHHPSQVSPTTRRNFQGFP